ncbi:Hsp70 family protein [Vibrio viridaestus]|uniref:Molecular chaperone DnaK n=1 Tax=Vibrio viridaestus TaxID=2487322 RepID=A0A3N9U6E6_9VIBR|nr:Hsp70 family protein [Vibrio viridaestus]RQW63646.1 molecular chaperone DnaK [Vibrio viridaestus]
MAKPRYLVGIDLGTTNTVVSYCENSKELTAEPIKLFEIDQLIGPGEIARRALLPSFRYHPAVGQVSDKDLLLPWQHNPVEGDIERVIIGEWARELGVQVEGRQVSSAKSWLSHSQVDREDDILPWAANDDTPKVSPVVASASYLNHIRHAWNHRNPLNKLEDQEVAVTVPASFDETARKLTIKAARLAGLEHVYLLEEPQAVCYDWYTRNLSQVQEKLANIPLLLIADVGGGTTDLSLIKISSNSTGLVLDRIGVGDHLMLGGDNIDLALAHLIEQRLSGNQRLSAAKLTKLVQQTRKAKESLLAPNAPESAKITMLGSGSRLIGGSKSIPLSKQETHSMVFDGFFPITELSDLPMNKRSAVVEFGLPYVSDAAVSKHIAAFLQQHSEISKRALGEQNQGVPVALLLNGGVFNSELVRERMQSIMNHWSEQPVTLLDNPHPDWAVALGAVAYLKARRGAQLKIGGGSARSYFLHLQENKKNKALCLLAKGSEEGQEVRLTSRRFALTLDEPVRFNLLSTTADQLNHNEDIINGLLTNVDTDNLKPLPPYITALASDADLNVGSTQKNRIEVYLASQLTPVGTLQLECVSTEDSDKRWMLEFEVRKTQSDEEASVSKLPTRFHDAAEQVSKLYSGNKQSADDYSIKTLNKDLEKMLGNKEEWDLNTSRSLFDVFIQGRKRRRRSELHERSWLRTAGFCLRPGFGDATDPWRIDQVWQLYPQRVQFQTNQTWNDWWTFWRRIAGGLNQEQQETILADIAKYLHPGATKNGKLTDDAKLKGYESMVRLSASLEHLEAEDKVLLATWFMNKALRHSTFTQPHWWAVGRLCSRSPLYGSLHKLVPKEQIEQWLPKILDVDWNSEQMAAFACVMVSRKTGDRTRDISDASRDKVLAKLTSSKVPESWITLVTEVVELDANDSKKAYGESLPNGLMLLK